METRVTPATAMVSKVMTFLSDFMSNPLATSIRLIDGLVKLLLLPFTLLWVFLKTLFTPAFEYISNHFNNVLVPAFFMVRDKVAEVRTAFETVQKFIDGAFKTALENLNKRLEPIRNGFQNIANAVRGVFDEIKKLIGLLPQLKLPEKFTPGSPTPAELGFRGIADALATVNAQMGALQANMPTGPAVGAQAQVPGQTVVAGPQITIPISATITDGMTQAAFEALVERTVRRSLT